MLMLHVTHTYTSCGPYTASVGAVNVHTQLPLATYAYVRVSIRHPSVCKAGSTHNLAWLQLNHALAICP